MGIKNTAISVYYYSWDEYSKAPKTSDYAYQTVRLWQGAGTSGVVLSKLTAGTMYTPGDGSGGYYPAQVDSSNCPGLYRVDLTAAENNYDFLTLSVKTGQAYTKIEPVTWHNFVGDTSSMRLTTDADVVKISGDSTAADNLEAAHDGTGYAGGTVKQEVDINKISGDSVAADNLEAAMENALSELGGVPSAPPKLYEAVMFMYMALRNKIETTSSQKKITNDAGSTIATSALSDDGTTFTKGEYS